MAVTFEEQNGSPKERRDHTSFHATRTGLILWSMRNDFITEHMGTQYPFNLNYYAPVRSIHFEPWGKMLPSVDTSVAVYEKAKAIIQYGTPTIDEQLQQDPITERIEPFTKYITLDHKNFQWGAGKSQPVVDKQEAPTRLIKGLNYTKTFLAVTQLHEHLLAYVDSVNSVDISPTSVGFENLLFQAGTLLFNAPTITRTVDRFGQVAIQVNYKFTHLPNWNVADPTAPPEDPEPFGWNGYYRAETQKFERIYKSGEEDVDKYFRSHPAKNFLDVLG